MAPNGSRFVVDLGSIQLPTIVEKQVETDIRAVVLEALAKTDSIRSMRLDGSIFDRFMGRTLGLWIDPDHPEEGSWEDAVSLSDHTAIVEAVMNYPMQVLKHLDWKSSTPTEVQILEAALKVQAIEAPVKRKIESVLNVLSQLESAGTKARRSPLSETVLNKELAGRPIDEQIRILRDPKSRLRGSEGSAEILDSVAFMLEEGRTSIYSVSHPFYQMISEGGGKDTSVVARDAVDTVKDADAIGGALGGGAGLLIAGVGAGPGAAAGAASASVGAIVGSVIAWLTD